MFPLQEAKKITVVLALTGEKRSFPADSMSSCHFRRSRQENPLDEFSNVRARAESLPVALDEGTI
jgi:DNA gyrase subunit A